jgi:PhoPQ-activated pathogenicity-related protein
MRIHKQFLWQSLLSFLFFYYPTSYAQAPNDCQTIDFSQHPESVLSCYMQQPEQASRKLIETKKLGQVTINKYVFTSLFWPSASTSNAGTHWQHSLTIYRPDTLKHTQALLFIQGGTRNKIAIQGMDEDTLFSMVASATQSTIVNLKDIPNQYLTFDDGIPRKEDGIIAYSWNQYLNNPHTNAFWPAHLPMAKATIKAMDIVQAITKNSSVPVSDFILVGASKRGWTAWLSLVADDRVKSIIPIVIDVLNMRQNFQHIHDFYGQWPIALKDYLEQGVIQHFNTKEFDQLSMVEDPLAYKSNAVDTYLDRLSKPKYIIAASQDQFFPPDAGQQYISQLPGKNYYRLTPNQSHGINPAILIPAILGYYLAILDNSAIPALTWQVAKDGSLEQVSTEQKPIAAKLWVATNPDKRDFRPETGIKYQATDLNGQCNSQGCIYKITLPKPAKGYSSAFVELSFTKPNDFVLTTPAFIVQSYAN